MAKLFMVATPIGNLEDLTYRAARILGEVDIIACEDTRHTSILLRHLGISKPLISCHARDEERGSQRVVTLLDEGKNLAYCSDAGTPGISDPGVMLARKAREAGHEIIPLPGPSAITALASVAGIYFKGLHFEGFLSPRQGRRKKRLESLMSSPDATMLYESPFRILKLLEDIASIDPQRQICIGREMTKLHEEFLFGNALELSGDLGQRQAIKGEFCILISADSAKPADNTD